MTLSVSTAVVLRQDLNSIAQAGLELTLLQAVLDPLVSDSRVLGFLARATMLN